MMTTSAEAEESVNAAVQIIDNALSHILNTTLVSASEMSDLLLDVRQKLTNN